MQGVGPGSVLGGRYAVTLRLSESAHHERWRASDNTLERDVVLVCFGSASSVAAPALDAARRAAGVEDARLVRVLDVGSDNGVGFIVEEPLTGAATLTQLLAWGGLPPEEVRRLVGESASALEKARHRGLHHLVLAPSSLLRMPDGAVKVRGLASDAALTDADLATGEQASRIDAVGLVKLAYAGLTARWPVAVSDRGRRRQPVGLEPAPTIVGGVAAPSEIVVGVPNDLDLIARMTLNDDKGPLSPGDLALQIAPWPSAMPAQEGGAGVSLAEARPAGMRPTSPRPSPARSTAERPTGGRPTGGRRPTPRPHASSPGPSTAEASGLGAAGAAAPGVSHGLAETTQVDMSPAETTQFHMPPVDAGAAAPVAPGAAAVGMGAAAGSAGAPGEGGATAVGAAPTAGQGPGGAKPASGQTGSSPVRGDTAPYPFSPAGAPHDGDARGGLEEPGDVDERHTTGVTRDGEQRSPGAGIAAAGAVAAGVAGAIGDRVGSFARAAAERAATKAAERRAAHARGDTDDDDLDDDYDYDDDYDDDDDSDNIQLGAALDSAPPARLEPPLPVFGRDVPESPSGAQSRIALAIVGALVLVALVIGINNVAKIGQSDGAVRAGRTVAVTSARPSAAASSSKPPAATSSPTTSATTSPAGKLRITRGTGFDPQDDGTEADQSVRLVFDGNPSSSWRSRWYGSDDYNGDKDGVGVVLDLESDILVKQVDLVLPARQDLTVYAGTSESLERAQKIGSVTGKTGAFTIRAPASMRPASKIIIWVTKAAPAEADNHYRAQISEVTVR